MDFCSYPSAFLIDFSQHPPEALRGLPFPVVLTKVLTNFLFSL